jgi:hypothetical protein
VRRFSLLAALFACLLCGIAERPSAQTRALLSDQHFRAIRDESSGELPLVDFRAIETRFTGFSPSAGGDRIADYLAARMREHGLADVGIEGFPADGRRFFWTFLTEPAWEPEAGRLVMVEPEIERIADYDVHRVALGRFSTSADITAELVDVGAGVAPGDYQGKDVRSKIVLASGDPGMVHAQAVWGHGAVGVLWYRTANGLEFPDLISNAGIMPWSGPHGEAAGFAFSVSYGKGTELRDRLRRGDRIRLRATVKATTGVGEYKQVHASIRGSDPTLPEVWVQAHDNYRNTGGGNNLTGVGVTVEIARVLRTLIASGVLPAPRRTIHFTWGAEHYASVYSLYTHPERRSRVLSMLDVDMVGLHQERSKAVFRLARLPYSMPHFLSDVAEDFVHSVGHANSTSLGNAGVGSSRQGIGFYDAVFAPTGSRDTFHYLIDEFDGPSDHEDVAEASLGVPAVMYGDWPNIYLGTQLDDAAHADATQLRRCVITVAATAYYLATVGPADVTTLAPVMVGYAQARLGRDATRANALIAHARDAELASVQRDAMSQLTQSLSREVAAIGSLAALGESPAAGAAIARARREIESVSAANVTAFREAVHARATAANVNIAADTPASGPPQFDELIPRRTEAIRGPVNFFRPEYGATWLAQKTGDPDFRSKVALATRGHYVLYETLNFANGKRTLREVRDAVSAEYGPVDLAEVEQYFRFLESVGLVAFASK